jgi:carboxyl-terminal processing protease
VETDRYGRILVMAMDQIADRYIEPVQRWDLFQGAMKGMTGELDEYSDYIPPVRYEEFETNLEQYFGGVGMEVSVEPETKQLMVLSPLVGTPAFRAGIRSGDRILKIDGRRTDGMGLREAVRLMRGKVGTKVRLTILHEGDDEPVELEIARAEIKVDSVIGNRRSADGSWEYFLEGREGIAHVRVTSFGERTPGELKKVIDELREEGMRGLILDVRNNPGGLLDKAADVCDLFIDSGVIVTTRRRDGSVRSRFEAHEDGTYPCFPMAVLVNQYSASASEIVAACLQDHERATIVGQRTWGKGTVQEPIELEEGYGALKITIATYWRPNGHNIHRRKKPDSDEYVGEEEDWGVIPDNGYEVKIEGEDFVKLIRQQMRRDLYDPTGKIKPEPNGDGGEGSEEVVDSQLEKAVEAVEKKLADE